MHAHAERGHDQFPVADSRLIDRSHALSGNAAPDALRLPFGDAKRHGMHAHAERGHDQFPVADSRLIDRSHALRGNAAPDALRLPLVTRSVTGCMPRRSVGTISFL
jgi:hypothetical protein